MTALEFRSENKEEEPKLKGSLHLTRNVQNEFRILSSQILGGGPVLKERYEGE